MSSELSFLQVRSCFLDAHRGEVKEPSVCMHLTTATPSAPASAATRGSSGARPSCPRRCRRGAWRAPRRRIASRASARARRRLGCRFSTGRRRAHRDPQFSLYAMGRIPPLSSLPRRERKKGRYLFGEGKKGEKNVLSFRETTIIYAGRRLIYSSAVSNPMTNCPQKLTELILSFSVMYDIACTHSIQLISKFPDTII